MEDQLRLQRSNEKEKERKAEIEKKEFKKKEREKNIDQSEKERERISDIVRAREDIGHSKSKRGKIQLHCKKK